MKSTTEMHEQELLGSEKQKKDFLPQITIDVDKKYVVNVKCKGLFIGELILSTRSVEFNPLGGMKIDVSIRNTTPLKK